MSCLSWVCYLCTCVHARYRAEQQGICSAEEDAVCQPSGPGRRPGESRGEFMADRERATEAEPGRRSGRDSIGRVPHRFLDHAALSSPPTVHSQHSHSITSPKGKKIRKNFGKLLVWLIFNKSNNKDGSHDERVAFIWWPIMSPQ